MKNRIEKIFDRVSYWQEKRTILSEISPDLYMNKRAVISMLNVSPQAVSERNQAKREMWNHQIRNYNMGDDILKQTSKEVLDDLEFAKEAVVKYNRTYKFLSPRLKASKEIAKIAAMYENDTFNKLEPILQFMPETHQKDSEIAMMATTRNIENIAYAPILRKNKYFILDVVNLIYEDQIRHRILQLIDPELLNDKWFVSQLGCFDGLCDRFRGDIDFVSYSVLNDIKILDKTEMFHEKIVKAVFKSSDYKKNPQYALAKLFEYIEHFNEDYEDLETKINDKKLLNRIFWEMAQIASRDYSYSS